MGRCGAAAVRVGCVLLGVVAARAQDLSITHIVEDRQICSVQLVAYVGAAAPGGLTFLRVEAENHDGKPHRLFVEAASNSWQPCDVQMQRTVLLGPNERARFFLPLPTPYQGGVVEVIIDAHKYQVRPKEVRGQGLAGLFVSDRSNLQARGLEVLEAMSRTQTVTPTQTPCLGPDLPADWRLFTGFHVVVVDGRTRLEADVQEALRRFVFSGGTLVVAGADRLPAGSVRDLCATMLGDEPVAHGLGLCTTIPELGGDTSSMRQRVGRLPVALFGTWPACADLLAERPIPGLGQAPVLVFLLVLLVFALLVGPVNFFVLRRLRRPLLALVTVPALGLGTTVVMLGYGLFHDGFDVRGVVRSWTLLDQERHECTAIAARTLFAGMSPSSLAMGKDTLLLAPHAFQRFDRRGPDRWHLDADAARLDGGVLPSRTPTPLLSGQHGVARQRLRVRSVGSEELHLLTDGGVAPRGQVVLRDFDGVYWLGQAPVLRRVDAAEAAAAAQRFLRAHSVLTVLDSERNETIQNLESVFGRCLGPSGLQPGSYLTQVSEAPWLDEHGLAVDYDLQEHFVGGRMQVEDFVR